MFKLFREMRKSSNLSMGPTTRSSHPRGWANPSQTVQSMGPYPLDDYADQGAVGLPARDGPHYLQLLGQF